MIKKSLLDFTPPPNDESEVCPQKLVDKLLSEKTLFIDRVDLDEYQIGIGAGLFYICIYSSIRITLDSDELYVNARDVKKNSKKALEKLDGCKAKKVIGIKLKDSTAEINLENDVCLIVEVDDYVGDSYYLIINKTGPFYY